MDIVRIPKNLKFTYSFKADPKLMDEVREYAKSVDRTDSHVIRTAIEQYLTRIKQRKAPKQKTGGGL